MARPTREKFIREPLDTGYGIGAKVRCRQPGRFAVLEENAIYTISWIDWPFTLEVEEVPGWSWDMRRFVPWTGPIRPEDVKLPGKRYRSGKGALF